MADVPTPAGLWVRTLAFGLDYLVIAAYLTVLVAVGAALTRFWPTAADALFGSPLSGEAAGFLLITLPVALYFALSEASTRQATWGKGKLHLKITDTRGARLSVLRAFVRTVLKFVPWELAHACIWQISFAENPSAGIYTIGFAVVWLLVAANIVSLLLSPERQTLYDWIAGTRVVRVA